MIVRVAQAALRDPNAQVTSWERTPLSWLAIAPTTGEIVRYSGASADGRSWSAILKVLRRTETRGTADWRREADVYASGFLDSLPPGITWLRACTRSRRGDQVRYGSKTWSSFVPVWPWPLRTAARDLGSSTGVPRRPAEARHSVAAERLARELGRADWRARSGGPRRPGGHGSRARPPRCPACRARPSARVVWAAYASARCA